MEPLAHLVECVTIQNVSRLVPPFTVNERVKLVWLYWYQWAHFICKKCTVRSVLSCEQLDYAKDWQLLLVFGHA